MGWGVGQGLQAQEHRRLTPDEGELLRSQLGKHTIRDGWRQRAIWFAVEPNILTGEGARKAPAISVHNRAARRIIHEACVAAIRCIGHPHHSVSRVRLPLWLRKDQRDRFFSTSWLWDSSQSQA